MRFTSLRCLYVLLPLGLTFGPADARQEAAPGFRERVLLENDHVYAVENTYDAGAASPRHTHRFPRVVYVLEGGTLELMPEGGEAIRVELEEGLTVWQPPVTHVVRNVGDSRVRVVEVEIKSAVETGRGEPGARDPDPANGDTGSSVQGDGEGTIQTP